MQIIDLSKLFQHGKSIVYILLLTGVYVGVFLHVGLLVEPFTAILARIWSRVGVD